MSTAKHVNRTPFEGTLVMLDEPSDKAPSGARGHKVIMPTSTAKIALPSLLGMGINFSHKWDTHNPKNKMGIITGAKVYRHKLIVSGYLFGFDFPEAVKEIAESEDLGMSYEIQDAHIADMRHDTWTITGGTFSGAAVISRDKAAYRKTSFALTGKHLSDRSLKLSLTAIAKAEGAQ